MTTDVSFNGSALSDAVPSAVVLSVARELVGKRRHVTVDVPGRAGSWVYPEEPGDRHLVLDVDVAGDTFAERRAAVIALANWCDTGQGRLIIDDEPDRFHTAILDNEPDPDEWLVNGAAVLKFLAGPYSEALALSSEVFSTATGSPASGTFTATDLVESRPVIEITARGGILGTFGIDLNGDRLAYGTTLAQNATVTISSVSATVTAGVNGDTLLVGAYDAGAVVMADVSGRFPLVVAGLNEWVIDWTGTATSIDVDIKWRKRYR